MTWTYVLENQGVSDLRSNQPVFLLINNLDIADDYSIFDTDTARPEFARLLDKMQLSDRLIIRSVEDIAESLVELLDIFHVLANKQITLCSCEEPFLSGEDYLDGLHGYIRLYVSFQKKKQQSAYQKALDEGRVGRPTREKQLEQAVAMYQTGSFKIAQIEAATGISKSALYRAIQKLEKTGQAVR